MMTAREAAQHRQNLGLARASGRWNCARKASVLRLLGAGEIAMADLEPDGFTVEEVEAWRARAAAFGAAGLKATKLQVLGHAS